MIGTIICSYYKVFLFLFVFTLFSQELSDYIILLFYQIYVSSIILISLQLERNECQYCAVIKDSRLCLLK